MPRIDTRCGRNAHSGPAEGHGPWRVGWSGPGRAAGVALAVGWRAAAALLRSGRLVRGTGTTSGEELETHHDRICEAVVARLAPGVKGHHHLRLGRALEASGGADPEVLAVHFHVANDLERAGGYYAAAAPRRGRPGPWRLSIRRRDGGTRASGPLVPYRRTYQQPRRRRDFFVMSTRS